MRGILQHEYNVPLEEINWFTWQKTRMEIDLPKQYRIDEIPPGKNPEEMLKQGELDAVILAALFPSLLQGSPDTTRLFENSQRRRAGILSKDKNLPDHAHRCHARGVVERAAVDCPSAC